MTYPRGLPTKYRRHWREPWRWRARRSPGFRRWLSRHGYLSPHFTRKEAACKDGTPLPRTFRYRARNHAFRLERFRHAVGNPRMSVLSWYRTRSYNKKIGGARFSRHIWGDATDFSKATVDRIGRARFFRTADRIFSKGGVGDYPAGSAHLDSRGWKARWRSF